MLYLAHYLSAIDNQKSELVTLRVIGFVDDYTLGDRETGSNCLRHHPNSNSQPTTGIADDYVSVATAGSVLRQLPGDQRDAHPSTQVSMRQTFRRDANKLRSLRPRWPKQIL